MSDEQIVTAATTVEQTVVPSEKSVRYLTLDAWRGFACVLLVIFHSTMHLAKHAQLGDNGLDRVGYVLLRVTTFCDVGVPIFFVISGYCIMATLDARRRNGEGVGIYFWRRFHRIYPPYWLALLLSAFTIVVIEQYCWPRLFTRSAFVMSSPARLDGWEWLGNLTLTESWRFHLTGGQARYLVGHAWTLCYEEQFYAIAGLILFLAPKRIFMALLIVAVSIPVFSFWAHRKGISLVGTIFGGNWFVFGAGIIAYYRTHHAGQLGRRITAVVLAVAMFLPAFDARRLVFVDSHTRFSWIVAMFFAFLLTELYRFDAQLGLWRSLRPFSYCGRMCYSLYLIHPLVTTGLGHACFRWGLRGSWETLLITLPACFTLSIAISAAFYFLVERHFLNGARQSRKDVVPGRALESLDSQLFGLTRTHMLAPGTAQSATS